VSGLERILNNFKPPEKSTLASQEKRSATTDSEDREEKELVRRKEGRHTEKSNNQKKTLFSYDCLRRSGSIKLLNPSSPKEPRSHESPSLQSRYLGGKRG